VGNITTGYYVSKYRQATESNQTTAESITIIITIIAASHLSPKQTWLHRKLLHVTSL
jgi:hypothetical protein